MLDDARRHEANAHLQRGLVLEQAGRYDEAMAEYREALACNPHLREAHDALAIHYQRQGLLGKAADELRTVAALDGDPIAYYNLGAVLADLGHFEAARAALLRCLALDPHDEPARLELAYADYACGRFDEALAAIEQLSEIVAVNWEAQQLRGHALLRLGRYADSILAYRRAIQLAGSDDQRDELYQDLDAALRYRELRTIRSFRDELYAEEGTVYLGAARDDGVRIPAYEAYPLTIDDLAVMLSRFLDLAVELAWPLVAVAPLDRAARPLALVIAQRLRLPLVAPEQVQGEGLHLLVGGVLREPAYFAAALERLPIELLAFASAITWRSHEQGLIPGVTGVVATAASLPWEADLTLLLRRGAPRSEVTALIEAACADLHVALDALPPEPTRARMLRFYARRADRLQIF